jgi:hypothetical protein
MIRTAIFAGSAIMTMTLVWTGVALWLGLNAAIAARCRYVALPAKTASARIHDNHQRRA